VVTLVEYALRVLAVIVIAFGLLCVALTLLLSEAGIIALFVVAFVAVTAAGSGAALLAIDLLYPQAVDVSGFKELLWVVVSASLASVLLFDLLLEGLVLKVLRRWRMSMPAIELVEAVAQGLFTAASLVIVARLMPDAALSAGAALAAGLIGAFVRYYIGLYLGDRDFIGDTD
jgi:hypothetical protein